MKKTFVLSVAGMMLLGASVFAKESTLIDFTTLDADITMLKSLKTAAQLWIMVLQLVQLLTRIREIL